MRANARQCAHRRRRMSAIIPAVCPSLASLSRFRQCLSLIVVGLAHLGFVRKRQGCRLIDRARGRAIELSEPWSRVPPLMRA